MKKGILFIFLIFLFSTQCLLPLEDTDTKNHKNAVFVEILGRSFLGYSINYERELLVTKTNNKITGAAGIGACLFEYSQIFPFSASYNFKINEEKGYFFETGLSVTLCLETLLHPGIEYIVAFRHQPIKSNFLFRVGVNPTLSDIPIPSFSFGMSF